MTAAMSGDSERWIVPDWSAPANVRALVTTRRGGVSVGPYSSLNLGTHVGDDPLAVAENRRRLGEQLPASPLWLDQRHGVAVVDAARCPPASVPPADAALARRPATVCAVLTADCLPILLCDRRGSVVAAAHAGWRGLRAGVIEETVGAMAVAGSELLAYLGPAIGRQAFEVGDEVRNAFVAVDAGAVVAFVALGEGKWLADLYSLAHQRLAALGVTEIYGGAYCTAQDEELFFSYRRDGVCGRMASLIWLEAPESVLGERSPGAGA